MSSVSAGSIKSMLLLASDSAGQPHFSFSPPILFSFVLLLRVLPLFRYPIAQASKVLGLCETSFKRRCRELGLKRWPYADLKRLRSKMRGFETQLRRSILSPTERLDIERAMKELNDQIEDISRMPEAAASSLLSFTDANSDVELRESRLNDENVSGSAIGTTPVRMLPELSAAMVLMDIATGPLESPTYPLQVPSMREEMTAPRIHRGQLPPKILFGNDDSSGDISSATEISSAFKEVSNMQKRQRRRRRLS